MSTINHPVHFLTKDGERMPSALIPFCEFGGSMSAMGQKIEQFDIPVCNSFKAKILNDQLCYEDDLDSFKNFENVENQIKLGFGFIMDYNEDRQTIFSQEKRQSILYKEGLLVSGMLETDDNLHAVINLNTIGMYTRYVI